LTVNTRDRTHMQARVTHARYDNTLLQTARRM